MRTTEEIEAELLRLNLCFNKVAEHDCLGNSNHEYITAQIKTLTQPKQDLRYVSKRIAVAITKTLDWLNGRTENKPSDSWTPHEKYSSHDRAYHLYREINKQRKTRRLYVK